MENQPSSSPKRQQHRALIAAILALASGTAVYEVSKTPEAGRQGHEEPNVVFKERERGKRKAGPSTGKPAERKRGKDKGETVKMKIGEKEVVLPKKIADALMEADKELKQETGKGLECNPIGPPKSRHGFGMAIPIESLDKVDIEQLLPPLPPFGEKEQKRGTDPNTDDSCEVKKSEIPNA